jgi:hypothetical protein
VISVVLGVAVWTQSVPVAVGWWLMAGVALTVPVRRARRLLRARREPDAVTAGHVLSILTGLDEVEHRAVELGPTWPRLSVGPNGVLVIDVCPGMEPGPTRRRDARILQGRLARTARTGQAARRALADAGIDIPVRTLAVAAAGSAEAGGRLALPRGDTSTNGSGGSRVGGDGSGDGVRLIEPVELSGALTAGPALPMAVVDAAFTSLTHAPRLSAD